MRMLGVMGTNYRDLQFSVLENWERVEVIARLGRRNGGSALGLPFPALGEAPSEAVVAT
jgi:hypothetical protein